MNKKGDIKPVRAILPNEKLSNSFLYVSIACFLLIKLTLAFTTNVLDDEAYYWTWGQNLELSYFDHPPLGGWMLGLSSLVFGEGILGLRLPAMISFAGSAYFIHLISKTLVPGDHKRYFLLALLAFLASPTLFGWTSIVYHDHLLIMLCLGAICFFLRAMSGWLHHEDGFVANIYFTAAFIGLAGLTKYSAIFVGLGFVFTVLSMPQLRSTLRSPHLYLAGLLAIALQAPTLLWNAQNELSSFQFHLNDRHSALVFSSYTPIIFFRFFAYTLVLFSPFLLMPMARMLFPSRKEPDSIAVLKQLGTWILVCSSIVLLALVQTSARHWYWSDLAYLCVVLLTPIFMTARWLYYGHFALGLVAAVLITVNYSVAPIARVFGVFDPETGKTYDWHLVSERVMAAKEEHNADFVGTVRFKTAAQLSYQMPKEIYFDLSPRTNQFDIWRDIQEYKGATAIVLSDHFSNLGSIRHQFQSLDLVDELHIERFGQEIYRYEIYSSPNATNRL